MLYQFGSHNTGKGAIMIFVMLLIFNFYFAFEVCIGITVQTDDYLPKWICSQCIYQLVTSYSFREKCLESLKYLEQIKIKEEPTLTHLDIDNLEVYSRQFSFKNIGNDNGKKNCRIPQTQNRTMNTKVRTKNALRFVWRVKDNTKMKSYKIRLNSEERTTETLQHSHSLATYADFI